MDGYVTVRATISTDHYKRLNQIAAANDTTVAALVGELTRRALTPPRKRRSYSKYTPELGARIVEARRLNRSWKEISRAEGIAYDTVRKYWGIRTLTEARAATARNYTNGREA